MPPAQAMVVGVPVIAGAPAGAATVPLTLAEQPLPSVIVTVYVPAPTLLKSSVVAPLLQT